MCRASQIDAGLLVNAMTKTSAFEVLLSRRFTGITLYGFNLPGNPFDVAEDQTIEGKTHPDATKEVKSPTIPENPFNVSFFGLCDRAIS